MKTSIKKLTVAVVALTAVAGVAQATLLSGSWSGTEDIPDGSAIGIANSLSISDPGNANIQDLSVNLDISGGYNGDLYGYLVFQPTGGGAASMEVLLNQIGTESGNPFGSSGAGMDVTLSDSGTANGNIHNATGVPIGVWQPDSTSTLDSTFTGSADGTWTLFLADLTAGAGAGQLVGWGVDISVVPEPVTWALVGFGVLVAASGVCRWLVLVRK
jgi:subtilisin-like proprotein convertase family protein